MRPVRVEEAEVVAHWLRLEPDASDDPSALSRADALDALLTANPGAAAFVWQVRPATWYRLRLPRERFGRLRVIEGPEELGWHALSPDGTVLGAARRIEEGTTRLPDSSTIDVDLVERLADDLARGEALPAVVATTRRGCAPTHVVDGNHRATATGLHLLRTGAYEPLEAYLGVGANPVLAPIRERLCGAARRLLDGDSIQ
ncbi:hypothetical protein ACFQPA_02855 [Halomarina halobia]|uniref:ParB/Sulfiredoxin domain-containing protein n=1 Tax=Halomarina halobia TaxID=3033386 RepID=A0ABD6A4S9_9EURY|nr:hypothetical protein [Halomarina sp. PSR21]